MYTNRWTKLYFKSVSYKIFSEKIFVLQQTPKLRDYFHLSKLKWNISLKARKLLYIFSVRKRPTHKDFKGRLGKYFLKNAIIDVHIGFFFISWCQQSEMKICEVLKLWTNECHKRLCYRRATDGSFILNLFDNFIRPVRAP